ncbi:thiol-activated cytolysin family protein [Clostridium butyricum]|uniref:thiol-activated cytolysin family protein n=1 Tax=Clostridium butyricum TaxID=1492 RepID=UPI003D33BACC
MLKSKKLKGLICISVILTLNLTNVITTYAKDASTQTQDIQSEVNEGYNNKAIDDFVGDLKYDKMEVLANQGDKVESFMPKSSKSIEDKFIVVERTKKSINTTPVDISIIDSMTDKTYPGALQIANRSFMENKPTLLTAKRKPINISIDLPGMGKNNSLLVDNPTYGNISGSIDNLVSKWVDENSDTHTLPARTQYTEAMVHSQSQINAELNINAKALNLGLDFNAISKNEKKAMIVAYKQIFYTVSAELPNNPSDLFDDSVTVSELERKGVTSKTPPLMVSNVAYGRTIYVKLETTSSSNDVESAFNALVKGIDINEKAKYKDILDQSSFTAVVLGGDAYEHNKIITKDFDEIRNVIKENSQFNAKNPAYPISYTSVFLKDNSVAAIHNNTEYVETTSTEYTKGKITLDHYGAYVAQFNICWDEVSYDDNGNELLNHKTWDGNWEDKTAHFSTVIPLPANAKNIRIFARECTGLAWEWWRNILDEYNVPLTDDIKVEIGGTTLYPSASISTNK